MPAISSGDKTLLRSAGHRSNFLLFVHRPETIWSALINDGSIGQGETAIAFDGGSGSAFSLIAAYQEIWVGTSAGAHDIGRLRVRSISSGDGGVTGTVTVAEHNLYLGNNYFLTFRLDYPIKPIYPKIDSGGTFYKDRDTAYGSNYNDQPEPVVLAGGHRAERIDASLGYAQFNVDVSGSYAVASGASISSYAISVLASAGFTTSFDTGTGLGYVRFTAAGQYWVRFTATDSNGKTQATHRLYFVVPNDVQDSDYGYRDFAVSSLSGDWTSGGWQAQVDLTDNAGITEIPDNAIVLLWRESWFGTTKKNITFADDDSGTLLSGYAQNGRISRDLETGADNYTLSIVTLNDVLNQYQFSVSLEAISGSPTKWYEYASWLTVGRIIHHILKWHSTALEVADVIGLTANTDGRAFGDIAEGTVYNMCNNLAEQAGIRAKLISDQLGRLHLTQDPQLLPDSPRGSLTVVQDIVIGPAGTGDISGAIAIQDQQTPPVAMAKVSGFYFDGTFSNGLPNVQPYCAIAPGTVPHDVGGATIATLERQVFTSQSHANQIAGRLFATKNNPKPIISFAMAGNYAGVIDPAYGEAWTMDLQATQNPRGLVWGDQVLYCRRVDIRVDVSSGTMRVSPTFEPEASSFSGITTDCLGLPTIGGSTPPIPSPSALPGALVTAASVNYLTPNSKAWTVRTVQATNDLVADPFWRSRQGTNASASAILWRCGDGFIKRSTDGGSNWTTVTPAGSPTNDANDDNPAAWADVNFTMLAPSWSTQGTFYCIGRWQNDFDLWRSWLLKTTNDGGSWANVQLGQSSTIAVIDTELLGAGGGTTTTPQSSIAVLDSTNFIGIINDNRAGWYGVDGSYVITEKDTVTTFNSNSFSITAVSSTKAVVTYRRGDVGSVGYGGCLVLETSTGPDTLTHTSTNNFVAAAVMQESRVVALSSSQVLVVYRMASPASDELFAAYGNISGTTVTWASTVSLGSIAGFDIGLVYVGSDTAILTYSYNDGGGTDIYARVIDTSGATPSAGAATQIVNGASFAIDSVEFSDPSPDNLLAQYDSTTLIRAFEYSDDQIGIVAFTFSGSTINSVGTPIDIGAGGASNVINRPAVTVQGSSIVVSWGNHTTARPEITTATVSGTTLTASGTVVTLPIGDALNPWWPALADLDGTALVGAFAEYGTTIDDTLWVATINLDGTSYAAKARGVDASKVAGGNVWVTALINENHLAVLKHTASPLALATPYALGSATLAQFDARTYDAVPFCSFTDDNQMWVYGRMNAPQSLSNPTHIMRTDNAGSSWTEVESGWASDVCGALVAPPAGILVALRANSTNSKLYRGSGTSLFLINTLPTGKTTNPHGVVLDLSSGAVFAASGAANATMVVGALPPYAVWKDFTYDHSTAAGVNAIELL